MMPLSAISLAARLAKDDCLLATLGLYLHGEPVSMNGFVALASVAPQTARKLLPAMKKHGLVTVSYRRRGATRIARITLTDLGRQVGGILHQIDALPAAEA